MKEYIISEEVLSSIRKTCYEAGKHGKQVYTVRGPSEEIVRCGECKHAADMIDYFECERRSGEYFAVEPDFFCKAGERSEA